MNFKGAPELLGCLFGALGFGCFYLLQALGEGYDTPLFKGLALLAVTILG